VPLAWDYCEPCDLPFPRGGECPLCPVSYSPKGGELPAPTCCPDAGGGAMIRLDDGSWCCVWCERVADAGEPLRQLAPPEAAPAAIGPPRPAPTRIPGPGRNQSG
jgi:hypothetical protein